LVSKVYKLIKYIFISFILLLSSFQHLLCQKSYYAEQILNEICSEKYHGRGYEYDSDKLAAKFIIEELKKDNVKHFTKDYKQPFYIQVNTFPGNNSVKIGERNLDPGKDYMIASYSKSLTGTLNIVKLTSAIINDSIGLRSFIKRDLSKSALFIDTMGIGTSRFNEAYDLIVKENVLKAKLVICVEDKGFTYSPSQEQLNFTCISLKREVLPIEFKTITVDINSDFLPNYQTNNIVGYIEGRVDSSIVITGHYDHIGMMGLNVFFPGANDNGSGVAMLLNLAKYYSKTKKPKYNIVFIFFSAEEIGLLGSKYYVENPIFPLSKIKFLINLDMVGTGSKGIKVVNGTVYKHEFNKLVKINNSLHLLVDITPRAPAANSDHYYFYQKGVKSFFIYTLGDYNEYHNLNDKPDILPLTEFDDLSKLLIEFIASF
jgi:aminopeptidase YwaD